jgi:hypothetical protein
MKLLPKSGIILGEIQQGGIKSRLKQLVARIGVLKLE